MYSDKTSSYCIALHTEGQCVFESFKQFVTLSTIFCRTSLDPKQVKFREPLSATGSTGRGGGPWSPL
jgi:hypothetical protein